jgi:predicted MFS family arabinose efflux permease
MSDSSMTQWRRILPIFLLGLAVLSTTVLTPALVGIYVDSFGLSMSQAGYTAAAYLFGAGAGGLFAGSFVRRLPTRTLLIIGLSLLAVGNLISIYVADFSAILAIRLITGIGEGIGFGLMGAFVSRQNNPGRVFAVFTIVMQVFGALILWSLPWVRNEFGGRMVLLPLAVAPVLLFAILKYFPDLTGDAEPASKSTAISPNPSFDRNGWLTLAATFVLYVAYGAVFSYSERLGVHAGVSADFAARMLAAGSLLALAGAGLAAVLAGPRAIGWKICIALFAVIASTWALVSGSPNLYVAGVLVSFLFWAFFFPSLMILPLQLDRSGGLSAATLGVMQWGMAAGPALAGFYMNEKDLAVLGPFGTVGFVAGILLLLPVIVRVRSSGAVAPALNVA